MVADARAPEMATATAPETYPLELADGLSAIYHDRPEFSALRRRRVVTALTNTARAPHRRSASSSGRHRSGFGSVHPWQPMAARDVAGGGASLTWD